MQQKIRLWPHEANCFRVVHKQHTSLGANPAPLACPEPPHVSKIVQSGKGLQESDFYAIKSEINTDADLDFHLFRFILFI